MLYLKLSAYVKLESYVQMNTTAFQLDQAIEQSEIYRSILNIMFVALITYILDNIFSVSSRNDKIDCLEKQR